MGTAEVINRLDRIQATLDQLVKKQAVKDFYSVDEFAALTSKRPFTVREWCRLGRVRAQKRQSGRGKFCEWVLPHEELLRYEAHGLLPVNHRMGIER